MPASGYLSQTQKTFQRAALVAALVCALLVLALSRTRALEWLESGAYDARVRWSADPARADKSIVIIDIDNASFDELKGSDKLGRWPWTRRVWTELVRYMARGKPKVIVLDAIYGGKESPEVDDEFARVMREAGNVVLAYSFSPAEMGHTEEGAAAAAAKWKLLEPETGHAPQTAGAESAAPSDSALNVPLDELAQAAAGLGSINSTPDPDGAIRRIPLEFVIPGGRVRSLTARTADWVSGSKYDGYSGEARAVVRGGQRLPLDASGRMLLLWHGDASVYRRVSLWQMIASIYPQQWDQSVEKFPPEFFRDKIVLVGASAASIYDFHPTPFEEQAPGFTAHATGIDNLLHGEAMRPAPAWFLWLAVFVMSFAGAGILLRIHSTVGGVAALAAVLGGYAGGNYLAFARAHLWLPLVAPVAALALSYVSAAAIRYATTGRELRRTRGTLDRYISPALVDYVLENLETVELGGQKKELTILFSDVRNFTTLTESADPTELIALLNEYLAAMTEIIFKYDGIVDKFIGDGILAYWGAFTPGKNHALLAAQASLEMLERLAELNRRWEAEGRKTIAIGVGLNTGEVIFGNVGSGKKIEFTVIGDPVNLASRLEGLNKEFKTSIIISEFTRAQLGDVATVRPLGGVKVKGKTIETMVFELQGLGGFPRKG
jgi:adenylate cyclase